MKILIFASLCFILSGFFERPLTTTRVEAEPDPMKGMVDRHNYWRAKVGVAPLVWSTDLARFAQQWADELGRKNCEMEHRPRSGKFIQKYGENIYWCSGMKATTQDVVDSWASELEFWNEKTLECNGEWWKCGHYTQLVWHSTTQVGCGMARCGDEEIWVCNYNPPGNYVGEKPYTKK